MTWFFIVKLSRNTISLPVRLSRWNGQMQCSDNFVLVISHFSASATNISPTDFCEVSHNRHMLSTHHQCPYSTYSSVWEFPSHSVLKRGYVLIYTVRVWGWRECLNTKLITEFREMQTDTFPASSSQKGLHLKRNSKIKINFVLRLYLYLISLN